LQVTKKKQKSRKFKDKVIKKEKKRKKEKKKHGEKSMSKGQQKKRKKEQESKNFQPVVSTVGITSKSRSKNRSEQNLPPEIPSSSKNTVDTVSGRYKKRAQGNGLDVIENNVNNLESVNNEINEAELSAKLHPILQTSESSKHLKPYLESTMNANKIPFLQIKEDTTLLEYDKMHKFGISEKERKSEREKMLPEVSSITTNIKQDAKIGGKNNIESNSYAEFELGNSTDKGDLSCINGTFLPATYVANAEIKYTQ
jgi:hypothetical protein